jgi:hypothetical protein
VPIGDEPRCQSQVVPLSAAAAIPTAPVAAAAPAAPAAKNYRADNFAAMQTRAKTLSLRHGISAPDGNAEPREPVSRKTRPNGLRPTF